MTDRELGWAFAGNGSTLHHVHRWAREDGGVFSLGETSCGKEGWLTRPHELNADSKRCLRCSREVGDDGRPAGL